jgi:hypothetical protein
VASQRGGLCSNDEISGDQQIMKQVWYFIEYNVSTDAFGTLSTITTDDAWPNCIGRPLAKRAGNNDPRPRFAYARGSGLCLVALTKSGPKGTRVHVFGTTDGSSFTETVVPEDPQLDSPIADQWGPDIAWAPNPTFPTAPGTVLVTWHDTRDDHGIEILSRVVDS